MREANEVKRTNPVQWLRRAVQFGVVAFFGYLAVRHIIVGEAVGVTSTSAEAYCAFGGLEGLYKFISSGGSTLAKTHLSNIVILAAAVLATLLARGFFCGWICPFGTIQEWLGALGRRLFKRRWFPPARVDAWLKRLRYVTLAVILAATIIAGKMVFQAYDPFAALLKVTELGLGLGGAVLLAVLIGSLFVDRPWCRYLCPLGGFLGLVGVISLLRVRREPAACINCGLCDRRCPVGVKCSQGAAATDPGCIGCLECVSACPAAGALDVGLGGGAAGREVTASGN